MERRFLPKKNNTVRVCTDKICIDASGKNAETIANAAAIMLLLFGVAALVNAVAE